MHKQRNAVIAVLVLMGVTSLGLVSFVDVNLVDQPGVRMTLPSRLGEWTGQELRYCHAKDCKKDYLASDLAPGVTNCPSCGGLLFPMSLEEYEQLPKDTMFVKSRYEHPNGDQLHVSIVLTGRERESIHRPERCLVGQGYRIERSEKLEVKRPGRPSIWLSALLSRRVMQTRQGTVGFDSFYAFWFVGQNRETHSHWWRMFYLAWDRVVHSVAHRWAYVSIAGRRDGRSRDYGKTLQEFVPLLHDAIVLEGRRGDPPPASDGGAGSSNAAPGGAGSSPADATTRNPTSAPR